MSSPEEFLAALDHVVADYETSDDAMRWVPEPPPLRPVDTWAGVLGDVGRVTVTWDAVRRHALEQQQQSWDVWLSANPSMVGAARMVATSTAVQGASPTRMVMDELAAFMGRAVEPLRRAAREIKALERRTATTDPDKPGRVIALRHGVVAQHSPYGPKPRSRDGRMQGDDARRARLSPTGRPRRSRAHLGDRDRT